MLSSCCDVTRTSDKRMGFPEFVFVLEKKARKKVWSIVVPRAQPSISGPLLLLLTCSDCPIFVSTATSLGSLFTLGFAFSPLALHVKKKIMSKEGKEQVLKVWAWPLLCSTLTHSWTSFHSCLSQNSSREMFNVPDLKFLITRANKK